MTPKSIMFTLALTSFIFTACMFVVPLFSHHGSFVELDGSPGFIDHWDIWSSKDPLTCFVYTFGDIFCHQEGSRTIVLNGSQMPICVRDLGLLIGLTIGSFMCFMYCYNKHILDIVKIFVPLSFMFIVIDWLTQHFFLLNIFSTRAITGFLFGVGLAMMIYYWLIRKFDYILSSLHAN